MDEVLGRRLVSARQDAGLTQGSLASRAGLERSVVAKVETGRRRLTAVELARLADALGQRLEWFFTDPPSAVISRRNAMDLDGASPIIDQTVVRIAREIDFIQSLHRLSLPASPQLPVPASGQDAEDRARQARRLLGIEPGEPALNLADRCTRVGLLPFSLELGDEAADGAAVLFEQGALTVINGDRAVGRRRLTLAHELGHFLFADEFSVDWRVADQTAGVRESLIDRFARAVLIPGEVTRRWNELVAEADLRTAVVRLGSEFRVDMATLARRLVELELVSSHEADQVRRVRTTKADIVDFDLLVSDELAPPYLPQVYVEAVLDLFRAEAVSRDRALDLLLDTWADDDLPSLPTLPEQATWQFIG